MKQIKQWMIAAILLCGTTLGAQAQESKHEIGVSYGAGSNSTVMSFLEDVTTITSTAGAVTYDDATDFGAIAIEYFYHISPKVAVGGVAAYANSKRDLLIGKAKEGEVKVNYYTVMPAVKLDWFQKQYFGMYSKLAAGVTFRGEKQTCNGAQEFKDNSVQFNWQASLVGIEAGSEQIRGFLELGCGEQGIGVIGIRCKF